MMQINHSFAVRYVHIITFGKSLHAVATDGISNIFCCTNRTHSDLRNTSRLRPLEHLRKEHEWLESANSESQPPSVFVLILKGTKQNIKASKVPHCKRPKNIPIKGHDSASAFIYSNLLWQIFSFKSAFHVGGDTAIQIKTTPNTPQQTESRAWDRKGEGVGSLRILVAERGLLNHSGSLLEESLVSRHFKHIYRSYSCILDCRTLFIHIIGFCHFFKNLFTAQNVCLYVCTEQSCYFILFSLLDVIYKGILQVWYFMVSTTVHFLYL